MELILLLGFYLLFSVLIIYLCQRFPFINKIGAIAIAYVIGIIIGNIGIIPEGVDKNVTNPEGTLVSQNSTVLLQEFFGGINVALGIPLLLFSLNMKKWLKYAKKAFAALFLGLISILVMIIIGYFIFRGGDIDMAHVGGLLTGVYTGGSPNMGAIQMSLNVDHDVFIATSTYDMFLSAVLFLFLISYAQKVFGWILPPFKKRTENNNDSKQIKELTDKQKDIDSYEGFFKKQTFLSVIIAFMVSVVILGLGYVVSTLIPEKSKFLHPDAALILSVTTLGILASFIPRISKLEKSFQLGMYFIIVFSLTIASMADITKLINISRDLFLFVALGVYGSLILHLILSKIFKVDTDTFIVVTTALTFSPPFVPAVASAIKNKEVIITGLIIGLVGYAIGNFLGWSVGTILSSF